MLGGSGDSSPNPWEGFPGENQNPTECLGREELPLVGLKKCTFLVLRARPWTEETVDPKSCYRESQLLTGVGSERNRQWWYVWVGAHVCLTENILL